MTFNPALFLVLSSIGLSLALAGLVIKPFFTKRYRRPKADVAGYDLGWQFSLAAGVFAVAPLPLAYVGLSSMAWRIGSLFMAFFFLVAVIAVLSQMVTHGARWPGLTIFLLVLSAIFLTIELFNVFIWGSPREYLWGVLWILGIAIGQYIVAYGIASAPPPPPPDNSTHTYQHHARLGHRLRSHQRTGGSN